jgi:hypothetical protein
MQEDSVEIDGKIYIPSKRASKLVGYTKDYVGQLSRGGYLDAKLVGRSWFVTEDSIRAHKLKVHQELRRQKDSFKGEDGENEIPIVYKDFTSLCAPTSSLNEVAEVVSNSNASLTNASHSTPLPVAGNVTIRKDLGQYARRELARAKIEYEQEVPYVYRSKGELSLEGAEDVSERMSKVMHAPGVVHSNSDTVMLRPRSRSGSRDSLSGHVHSPVQSRRDATPKHSLDGVAMNVYREKGRAVSVEEEGEDEDGLDSSDENRSVWRFALLLFLVLCLFLPIVYVLWQMFL